MPGLYWGSTQVQSGQLRWGNVVPRAVYWGSLQVWPPSGTAGTNSTQLMTQHQPFTGQLMTQWNGLTTTA